MRLAVAIAIIFLNSLLASAQFAVWTDSTLVLNNGIVQRVMQFSPATGTFFTTSYKPIAGDYKYFQATNIDFGFLANDTIYSGKTGWKMKSITRITDSHQGNGAAVTLISADNKVELSVRYLLYPALPVVRKSLVIKNVSSEDIRLESVDVERFNLTAYHPSTFSWVCSDYGRRRTIGPYEGNAQDALTVIHNLNWRAGIVIGNEATGVLKRTSFLWGTAELTAGLTHKTARYPFRKWLKPGETFETPQVFTMVYNNYKAPEEILNTAVPDFVRKHMGIRLSELKEKPTFVYNTWEPFLTNINEKTVLELAKAAAGAGMKEFVIDDGWQDNYGDWGIDLKKFPNGLKPVFDSIKALGMKPGLWLSVGSANSKSKVYYQHPEWFVKDKSGAFANLQLEGNTMDVRSACFSTGWKDYIKNILLKLALEYGLEYMKLDFSVVTSAYRFDPEYSGCYATDHPGHRDHHESMYANYEQMWKLFDELHAAKPDLFIDCTFEAMGAVQLIDYAMLKHAEGNWLSNFAGNAGPDTDLRVRQMAWWRSPAIPATALVIGNPEMQDKGWELHIMSLAGALPIMLGDPRELTATEFGRYRRYADWLQDMDKRYGFMSYRQDLPGFGEPAEGRWDGFQRINTETKAGGIIGVFRHGAAEDKRRVTVDYLSLSKTYKVKTMDGKVVTVLSGEGLHTTGFEVALAAKYAGVLYEITQN